MYLELPLSCGINLSLIAGNCETQLVFCCVSRPKRYRFNSENVARDTYISLPQKIKFSAIFNKFRLSFFVSTNTVISHFITCLNIHSAFDVPLLLPIAIHLHGVPLHLIYVHEEYMKKETV